MWGEPCFAWTSRASRWKSGAAWNGGALNSLKHGLDMRLLDSCLYNEYEEYTEFNAWWYCCFPLKVVREDNLPLPIFIRGDDLEYGLRNMKTLILLNGICVWHEPFENKYSSYLEYYIVRNQLIDNVVSLPVVREETAPQRTLDALQAGDHVLPL